MKPNPPIRKDGLCAGGCGKQVRPERWQKYAPGHIDPFCSTECCKKWHGVDMRALGEWQYGYGYEREWNQTPRPEQKKVERERRDARGRFRAA